MKLLSYLVDIIYPPRCSLCRLFFRANKEPVSSHHVCSDCLDDLVAIAPPMCSVCGFPFATPLGHDHLCENCLRTMPWYDQVRVPYFYSGLIREAIQRLKYGSETHLASSLGALLSSFARERIPNPRDCVIVPVPLHRRRLRERGFNQSVLLAKVLSSHLEIRLDYLSLIRKRDTKAQTGLGKEERRKNVRDAFSVICPEIVEGQRIVLVDDVFTTGHTLNECAKTLKKSGALAVTCFTVARTRFH